MAGVVLLSWSIRPCESMNGNAQTFSEQVTASIIYDSQSLWDEWRHVSHCPTNWWAFLLINSTNSQNVRYKHKCKQWWKLGWYSLAVVMKKCMCPVRVMQIMLFELEFAQVSDQMCVPWSEWRNVYTNVTANFCPNSFDILSMCARSMWVDEIDGMIIYN